MRRATVASVSDEIRALGPVNMAVLREHDRIVRDFLARARRLNPKKRQKPSQRLVLAVKRAKLTASQTSVGRAVADYMALFLDKGEPTFPSIEETIAPDSGCADSTAREACNFLEAIGFLDLLRQKGASHEFRLGWRLEDAPTWSVNPEEIEVEHLPLRGERRTWRSAGSRRGSTAGNPAGSRRGTSSWTPPNSLQNPAGSRRLVVPFKELRSSEPSRAHVLERTDSAGSGGSARVSTALPTAPRRDKIHHSEEIDKVIVEIKSYLAGNPTPEGAQDYVDLLADADGLITEKQRKLIRGLWPRLYDVIEGGGS